MEAQGDDAALSTPLRDFNAEEVSSESKIGVSVFLIAAIVWVAYGVGYFIQDGVDMSPQGLGGLFMTLCAPPALLWYVMGQFTGRAGPAAARSTPHYGGEFSGDASEFYQQAAEISQMSKAVLKSLQRARQGLRVEMRDFSGVSKKAEFHIDRLSDALHSKSEKITELTQSLEGKINVIEGKAQNSTKAWDNAVELISARSEEIETTLMRGADKILEAADRAHVKTTDIKDTIQSGFDELNDTVESISSQLEGVTTRFEGHTESMNEIVDHVSRETERLTDTIKDQIDDLESSAGRTVASVIESARTISSHKEEMESGVRELYNQSERVSELVKRSVSDLKDSVEYVSEHSDSLEVRLDKRSAALKEAVDSISKQADLIEEVGDQAANKLSESLSVAVGGAESISFAIRRAVEALDEGRTKANADAEKIVLQVAQSLQTLNLGAEENAQVLNKAVDLLDKAHGGLSSTVEHAYGKVGELTDRVVNENTRMETAISNLSGSVSSVGNTLSQALRDIQNAVNDVDSRHHVIDSVISRRVSDLADSSDRAMNVVEDIRSGLRGQLQEIATLTGQLSSQSRSINDNMLVQKEQVEQMVSKTLVDMEMISGALDTQISKIKDASSLSSSELEDIVNSVAENYEKITLLSQNAESSIESLDGVLMDKLSNLYDQSDRAKESFVSLSTQIAESAQSLSPACDDALTKADMVKERFYRLRDECADVSESNLHKFQQFGIMLEGNLSDLKAGSEEASTVLQSVNDVLIQRATALRDTSDAAVDNVTKAADHLRDQAETIHLLGDQAVVKMDSVQKEINAQFMDFSESVSGAIMELGKAGDQFVVQSESVQGEIQDNINAMKTAGVKAREEVFMLSEATQKVSDDTNAVIIDIEGRMKDFLGGAEVVLRDFKKTGDTISIRSRELSEQMRASLQTSEMYGREIKGQVSSIAGSSIEVAEQIGKAVSMLNGSMDNIGRAAHDTTDHILQRVRNYQLRLIVLCRCLVRHYKRQKMRLIPLHVNQNQCLKPFTTCKKPPISLKRTKLNLSAARSCLLHALLLKVCIHYLWMCHVCLRAGLCPKKHGRPSSVVMFLSLRVSLLPWVRIGRLSAHKKNSEKILSLEPMCSVLFVSSRKFIRRPMPMITGHC